MQVLSIPKGSVSADDIRYNFPFQQQREVGLWEVLASGAKEDFFLARSLWIVWRRGRGSRRFRERRMIDEGMMARLRCLNGGTGRVSVPLAHEEVDCGVDACREGEGEGESGEGWER